MLTMLDVLSASPADHPLFGCPSTAKARLAMNASPERWGRHPEPAFAQSSASATPGACNRRKAGASPAEARSGKRKSGALRRIVHEPRQSEIDGDVRYEVAGTLQL
jgi:hypothetical protein